MKKPSHLIPPAFWLFLVTFAARLFVLLRLSDSPYFLPDAGDMKFYNDWALRIAHGQPTEGMAFYGLPGYAFLLAGFYKLIGFHALDVPFAAGVAQAIADGFTSVFIWKIAREVFAGIPRSNLRVAPADLIGALAAAGWAFFQPAQTFSAILMPTAWMIAVFWFCVWRAMSVKQNANVWRPWLGLGILLGATAMVVATVLFLIPVLLAAVLFAFRHEDRTAARWGRSLAAAVILLGSVCLGASPCWLHNYFIAHEPVMLSAHSGINFYIGNNPIANGYPKIPPGMRAGQEGMLHDSITMAELGAGRPLRRFEVSRFWSAKASDYIHAHPAEWLRLMGRKFVNFWNAYQYDDLSLITLFANSGLLLPGLRFGLAAALALPGMALAAWHHRRARWVIAAVLLQMAALMPVFVTERYRLAAVPGLLLMGSYALWQMWDFASRSRWLAAAGFLAASALAAMFVSWPQNDPGLWSLDYYNTGVKAVDAGEMDLAQANLEMAYRYVPDNSEINFALGNLWVGKNDRSRAKQFYHRALEINPRHSGAWNNAGYLASEEKQWQTAVKCFQNSLAIEPADAKTRYLLARAELELGHPAQARQQIEEALKLKPAQREFLQLRDEILSRNPPNA